MFGVEAPFDLYPWFSAISSLFLLVALVYHLKIIAWDYRRHHDDRAAFALVKALGLVVVAFGLSISSSGLLFNKEVHEFQSAGISLVRGALIVVALALYLGDRHRFDPAPLDQRTHDEGIEARHPVEEREPMPEAEAEAEADGR